MDGDRSAVYAAEYTAFDGTDLEEKREFEELVVLLEILAGDPWWPGPPVEIRRARRDARSSSTRCESGPGPEPAVIRLASAQLTIATMAHELAHALAGVGHGHDPVFRAAYLDVITVLTNLDPQKRRHDLHVSQLASAFDASGLAVAPRRWPPPPASVAGPIPL
jgi:hypothetical protein